MQLFGGASDARSSLTRLAEDVSSWWANLDPSPKAIDPAAAAAAQHATAASDHVGSMPHLLAVLMVSGCVHGFW